MSRRNGCSLRIFPFDIEVCCTPFCENLIDTPSNRYQTARSNNPVWLTRCPGEYLSISAVVRDIVLFNNPPIDFQGDVRAPAGRHNVVCMPCVNAVSLARIGSIKRVRGIHLIESKEVVANLQLISIQIWIAFYVEIYFIACLVFKDRVYAMVCAVNAHHICGNRTECCPVALVVSGGISKASQSLRTPLSNCAASNSKSCREQVSAFYAQSIKFLLIYLREWIGD